MSEGEVDFLQVPRARASRWSREAEHRWGRSIKSNQMVRRWTRIWTHTHNMQTSLLAHVVGYIRGEKQKRSQGGFEKRTYSKVESMLRGRF